MLSLEEMLRTPGQAQRVLLVVLPLIASAAGFAPSLCCMHPDSAAGRLHLRGSRARSAARRDAAAVSMSARPRVAFVQTGGTIDKDYPRSTMGYAFEIADAATKRVMQDAAHVPMGIDYDFHTACRKVCVRSCSPAFVRSSIAGLGVDRHRHAV